MSAGGVELPSVYGVARGLESEDEGNYLCKDVILLFDNFYYY